MVLESRAPASAFIKTASAPALSLSTRTWEESFKVKTKTARFGINHLYCLSRLQLVHYRHVEIHYH
jgi:hypothetical protein